VLDQFNQSYLFHVLGGATGSGKTELLTMLASRGAQTIDLEGIANHKGSAFGGLGQLPQPSTEHFENLLALGLASQEKEKPIWIENESRLIGTCFLPEAFWQQLQSAPIYQLEVNKDTRIDRLAKEYGHFPMEVLAEKTEILRKKLGGQHANKAIELLSVGDIHGWLDVLLVYYDKTYAYGGEKNASRIRSISHDWNDIEPSIKKLLES
jgi:tRNA 2-selenouridine synthase